MVDVRMPFVRTFAGVRTMKYDPATTTEWDAIPQQASEEIPIDIVRCTQGVRNWLSFLVNEGNSQSMTRFKNGFLSSPTSTMANWKSWALQQRVVCFPFYRLIIYWRCGLLQKMEHSNDGYFIDPRAFRMEERHVLKDGFVLAAPISLRAKS